MIKSGWHHWAKQRQTNPSFYANHFTEYAPQRPVVRRIAVSLPFHFLWSHVSLGTSCSGCVHRVPIQGFQLRGEVAQTEIANLDVATNIDEDVVRLYVTVDDTYAMKRCDSDTLKPMEVMSRGENVKRRDIPSAQ